MCRRLIVLANPFYARHIRIDWVHQAPSEPKRWKQNKAGRVWRSTAWVAWKCGTSRLGRRRLHVLVCASHNRPSCHPHHRRQLFQTPVESKTRTHHGRVGSGRRTAGQRGSAGLDRTGRRWVNPARRQPCSCPPANRGHSLERLSGRTNSLIRI